MMGETGEIEMLKVGDRVRFKEEFLNYPFGYEAEVVSLDGEGDPESRGEINPSDYFFMNDLIGLTEIIEPSESLVGPSISADERTSAAINCPLVATPESPTILDQFAMAALTGLLAKYGADAPFDVHADAYAQAHAMMRARSEGK